MKNSIIYILVFGFFCLTSACKSAKDKFNDKDFSGAFEEAFKDLKKGKNKSENGAIVRNSLSRMNTLFQSKFNGYEASSLDNKAAITDEGIALLEKYDRAQNYIEADNEQLKNLRSQTENLRSSTGRLFSERAKSGLQQIISTKNKLSAPQVLYDLNKTESYLGASTELRNMTDDLFKYGTKIVVFELNQYGYYDNYTVNSVFSRLETESRDRLMKTYYNRNVTASDLDCTVRLDLSRPYVRDYTRDRRENFSENIQTGTETKKDANGKETKVPVYTKVTATVEIREIIYEIKGDVRSDVYSRTNSCNFRSDSWSSTVTDIAESYRITGDSRAVPSRYNTSGRSRSKSDRQLQEELISRLYDQVRGSYNL
jgi:hypothetical protein